MRTYFSEKIIKKKPCPTQHYRIFAKFQFMGICDVVVYTYDMTSVNTIALYGVCCATLYCFDAIKRANLYQYLHIFYTIIVCECKHVRIVYYINQQTTIGNDSNM